MTKILSSAGLGTQSFVFACADVQVFMKQGPQCCQCLPDTDTQVCCHVGAAGWTARAIDMDRHTDTPTSYSCYVCAFKENALKPWLYF